MATAFDIRILYTIFQDVRKSLQNRKDNTIDAHKSLYTAYIKTYDYLKNKNGQYKPNVELAETWNEASASVMKVDKNLGEMIYFKSRFWLDPELYINLNRDSEILELKEIIDEMERLRIKL